jgi:hypothetical protein
MHLVRFLLTPIKFASLNMAFQLVHIQPSHPSSPFPAPPSKFHAYLPPFSLHRSSLDFFDILLLTFSLIFSMPAGSNRLTFQQMRELIPLSEAASFRPSACIAFSSIESYKEISAVNLPLSRELLMLHNACVRETLSACGG